MPRQPRLEIPGLPLHIIQRGVNRTAIFLAPGDYTRYLHWLAEAFARNNVALHAYVLMTNHVHLLATPFERGCVSKAMQQLGRRYVAAFNRRHERTGTLWEGRFKSCLVETDQYLLAVCRYIERNPVRAAMVARPEDYPWSSVHFHLGNKVDPVITPHPCYLALAADSRARSDQYRHVLHEPHGEQQIEMIRKHLRQERALGSSRFQANVERATGRPVAIRAQGRPRKGDPERSG